MPVREMKVRMLESTETPLNLIYTACRQCYSQLAAADIFSGLFSEKDRDGISDFVRKVIASGHESPLEHVKFTFAIEGVSRALTHQLVRHRHASYSQQSQRYVCEKDFGYIVPPVFSNDDRLQERFQQIMTDTQKGYRDLLSMLAQKGITGELANQDARFVLPQAAETKIVVTMNCRELKHFFSERCCQRAQWEIRRLADKMLGICRDILPEVFSASGAKCEDLGYCPEGKKFTCGKYPVKEDVVKVR